MDWGPPTGAKIARKNGRFARLGVPRIAAGIRRLVSTARAGTETTTEKIAAGNFDYFGSGIDFVGAEKIDHH